MERNKLGQKAGLLGICLNIFLFLVKFFAGIITNALSISADAFNNLSDAASSVVTLIGFKLAEKPADIKHPYGHGRIEYIAGMSISVMIIIVGAELFRKSFAKIFHPTSVKLSGLAIAILIFSILIKAFMAIYNHHINKKVNSEILNAVVKDSQSDCIATSFVLASVIVEHLTGFHIDGFGGIVVALFIIYTGFVAMKDTLYPLLGKPADEEYMAKVKELVLEDNKILALHDLVVHDYGPGRVFVYLHAELPYNYSIVEAHKIIDEAERRVENELCCKVSIHVDPVITDDKQTEEVKAEVKRTINNISKELTIHDFQLEKTDVEKRICFDLLVPFNFYINDEELKKNIIAELNGKYPDNRIIIEIDHGSGHESVSR